MLSRVMEKVGIGGCGVTGAVIAALLRSNGANEYKPEVTIWEKSRGAGGRMSTARSPHTDKCTVDLGAQYISTTTDDYTIYKRWYDELLDNSILKPLTSVIEGDNRHASGTKHYVPPKGMSSLVKYFVDKSGSTTKFDLQMSEVTLEDGRWLVKSANTGYSEAYDCLILTLPTPQILQLKGDIRQIIESDKYVLDRLRKVEYSSRFAMGLFYKEGTRIEVPWAAKYFADDLVRFVSIDNRKRGVEAPDVGPSVVVHTSVPFGLANLEDEKEDVCTRQVLPRLHQLVPELPAPDVLKSHKWRYSQVFKPYEECPGCVLLHSSPPLILAGDAYTFSKFDGCLRSAHAAVEALNQLNSLENK